MCVLMASENGDNVGSALTLRYTLFLGMVLLCIFFTPKHLNLRACGMLSPDFVHNSAAGYRTLGRKQNHPKPKKICKPPNHTKTDTKIYAKADHKGTS